ncbi:uncharacterized protein LOC128614296 isoform X1 [Ictalurus furcatus]|uniref:uncharacterized protein LOC128614296 isoform X1 n=1 Tax=Ictalurus furcatus TaxID=66913 RepID=UPI002350E9D8|nr:uncharacterized protein LOC128614296 isoform X1 [Ictalurus furcatus]
MDLSKSFYEGLDKHVSKLLYLYRSRCYADIAEMSAILESLDKNASNHRKRVAALLGLPLYMRENPSQFLKICEHTDSEEELIKGMTVGIITVVGDVMDPIPCDCSDVALVIKEDVILGDVPNTFVNVMGLLYALNIIYPKNFKYTFEVIQRLFMNIGTDACSAQVHSLKNKLLKWRWVLCISCKRDFMCCVMCMLQFLCLNSMTSILFYIFTYKHWAIEM